MRRAAVVSLAILLVPVASAEAKLPSPKSKSIEINKSIAGVKIGMGTEKAAKAWGKGGSCDETVSDFCVWTSTKGQARFDSVGGKVVSIDITAPQRESGDYFYKTPLTKWKTSKKVRLGTSIGTVAKKYKKAEFDGSGVRITGGKVSTLFQSSGGRVGSLAIVANSQL